MASSYHDLIADRYGSVRGAVRLALSYPQYYIGGGSSRLPKGAVPTRLVFVCRGNISRSAFAEALAHSKGCNAASFGLHASQGQPTDPMAVKIAGEQGIDLSAHRATPVDAFVPMPGDYLLAMEVRQLTQIAKTPNIHHCATGLLGQYCGTPHLHDPFTLSAAYYRQCFARIARAIDHLASLHSAAKSCR